jgi:hypothetical protein
MRQRVPPAARPAAILVRCGCRSRRQLGRMDAAGALRAGPPAGAVGGWRAGGSLSAQGMGGNLHGMQVTRTWADVCGLYRAAAWRRVWRWMAGFWRQVRSPPLTLASTLHRNEPRGPLPRQRPGRRTWPTAATSPRRSARQGLWCTLRRGHARRRRRITTSDIRVNIAGPSPDTGGRGCRRRRVVFTPSVASFAGGRRRWCRMMGGRCRTKATRAEGDRERLLAERRGAAFRRYRSACQPYGTARRRNRARPVPSSPTVVREPCWAAGDLYGGGGIRVWVGASAVPGAWAGPGAALGRAALGLGRRPVNPPDLGQHREMLQRRWRRWRAPAARAWHGACGCRRGGDRRGLAPPPSRPPAPRASSSRGPRRGWRWWRAFSRRRPGGDGLGPRPRAEDGGPVRGHDGTRAPTASTHDPDPATAPRGPDESLRRHASGMIAGCVRVVHPG